MHNAYSLFKYMKLHRLNQNAFPFPEQQLGNMK